jgi:hypothetical protein
MREKLPVDIPLWSSNNPTIKEILLPSDGKEWNDLEISDKEKIWKYLETFLFYPNPKRNTYFQSIRCDYEFFGDSSWENDDLAKTIVTTVMALNHKYKKHSFADTFLEEKSYNSACHDFYQIYLNEDRDVVFELISIFSNVMVNKDRDHLSKRENESDKDFEIRKEAGAWIRFDKFSRELSQVFEEFGLYYKLSRLGFVLAEEPAVIDEVYIPTLKKLSDKKWAPVNRDLKDAFDALRNDKNGSGALTHALSGLQGFLQILCSGKTGKGDTSDLINQAIKNKIIPDDDFSKKILKEINAFWAKERQDKGDSHPKNVYATKKQAKLMISLVIVFIDYVL